MRDELNAQIVTNLTAYTNFSVSSELPWDSNDVPLYQSNMKTVYVDTEEVELSEIYQIVNGVNVDQTDTLISVYLSVDAKNTPTNLSSVLSGIRSAKDLTTVDGLISRTVEMIRDIQQDVTTYTFNFRFITI